MCSSSPLNASDSSSFLDQFDTILFDCDGVLWAGSKPFPFSGRVLRHLSDLGKQLIFVSNNSSKSRKTYGEKFDGMGVSVDQDQIFSTSYASAYYLSSIGFKKKIYVIGMRGICEELDLLGIDWVGGEEDVDSAPFEECQHMPLDKEVGGVLVGWDHHINYKKLSLARCYLDSEDSVFIATNRDTTYPSPGHVLPGTGTMVAAVEACAHREAITIGKPELTLMDLIVSRYPSIDKSRTLMIGDRLNTDILFGNRVGISTLLVTSTGVSSEADLFAEENDIYPTYYTKSLEDLAPS